jgi:hypothetical protein
MARLRAGRVAWSYMESRVLSCVRAGCRYAGWRRWPNCLSGMRIHRANEHGAGLRDRRADQSEPYVASRGRPNGERCASSPSVAFAPPPPGGGGLGDASGLWRDHPPTPGGGGMGSMMEGGGRWILDSAACRECWMTRLALAAFGTTPTISPSSPSVAFAPPPPGGGGLGGVRIRERCRPHPSRRFAAGPFPLPRGEGGQAAFLARTPVIAWAATRPVWAAPFM